MTILEADKVLLIVPTTSLVKQMVGDFAKYSENDANFDAENMCHEIMAGKDKGHEDKKDLRIYMAVYIQNAKRLFSSSLVW